MGFCRRCGDIVSGERCHCGGAAVAPAVSWKNSFSPSKQDRWSKTYVSSIKSSSATSESTAASTGAVVSAIDPRPLTNHDDRNLDKRFPRPLSLPPFSVRPLKAGVSDHISPTISNTIRPPSPLKLSSTLSDAENDILPSFLPNEPTLTKVYGSLLQPTETLPLHSCARCSSIFPPDATIYPDPSQSNASSFLCRNCFTVSGGSKGTCPGCSRPVLLLKAEGGFIQSGGQYWHKRCYNCAGCFKNIGQTPMVDLLGRPSCDACFENCLNGSVTPLKPRTSSANGPNISNPGGLSTNFGKKSRESSPAIEELEQRLGLTNTRQGSPCHLDTSQNSSPRLDVLLDRVSSSNTPSKKIRDVLEGTALTKSVLELPVHGAKSPRRINNAASEPTLSLNNSRLPDWSRSSSNPSLNESAAMSLFSNPTQVQSNPLANSVRQVGSGKATDANGTCGSTGLPSPFSNFFLSTSSCSKCMRSILKSHEGGEFVSVWGTDENTAPQFYHAECFKCSVCDKMFGDEMKGQMSFVKADNGPCHPQCAPRNNFVARKSLHNLRPMDILSNESYLASKHTLDMLPMSVGTHRPPANQRLPSKPPFPSFGGQNSCPGCRRPVSLMERGVVPGPQGTRWHASCLVCGGRKEVTRASILGRSREERKGEPGCGKRLDSAAKTDGEGRVWCRECLLLLGTGECPTRSPLATAFTGGSSPTKVATQSTEIARQMTGLGSSDMILKQLTGGGLSPTRSISPTKQLGMIGASGYIRPRPKSVVGSRSISSIDEGRGMYLVRQFTGSAVKSGT